MKKERDTVHERLEGIKKVAGEPATIDALEADARKEIAELPELLRSPDVVQVRNALAGYVEKVEIWPDKKARLYLQPGFMKQLGVGRVSIPRGLLTHPTPQFTQDFRIPDIRKQRHRQAAAS
jgi:hypothetical protein